MIKILIFRTDRIGDLIMTCQAILSLKKNFDQCEITLITSSKNTKYSRNLNFIDNVIELPRNGIINKIKFIFRLSKIKFNYIFIFDGKERSILTTTFIKSKSKVALTGSKKFYFNFLKIKFLKDLGNTNLNEIFQKMISHAGLKTKIENYDFIKFKKNNNFSSKIPLDKYILIHLDEKWFSNLYIKSYTDINPHLNDFIDFLNTISINDNLIITTGFIKLKLVDELINKKIFNTNELNIFFKKNNNKVIYLINQPTFEDIESLLRNSKKLISCHGAITHAAYSFNIPILDIIENNNKVFYHKYTSHMNKYTSIYRQNFSSIKNVLLSKLND